MVALQQQTQTDLFGNDVSDRYARDMMMGILNPFVVCGNEKECYKHSCFTRADGSTGIRVFDKEIALQYDYLYYATTFKRNNKKFDERIKVFIIDVDYKFVEDKDLAHKIVSDKILAPTYTTSTDKGYQFLYALTSSFVLSERGEKYARALNGALMDKFVAVGIEIDVGASSRLTSTFRNPLTHNYSFNNITYSVDILKEKLGLNSENKDWLFKDKGKLNVKSLRKGFSGVSGRVENKNESSAKYEKQKLILDGGFVEGNRNEYFYLLANKECVLNNIQSYNDSLMVCNMIADNLSLNSNESINNSEIKATAKKLFNYKEDGVLYMPSIFCTGSNRDINEGRYRAELNATVGYCDLSLRKSMAMKFVQRDRKIKTLKLIKDSISKLGVDEYISLYAITQKVALLSELSVSTVKRYLASNTDLLSSRVASSKKIRKKNVLDFMNLLNIGVCGDDIENSANRDITNSGSCNNIEYGSVTGGSNCNSKEVFSITDSVYCNIIDEYDELLCISDATDVQIELYERMGWEILPF